MIKFEHVNKTFADHPALVDITTEFKARKLGLGSYFGDCFNNEDKKDKTRIFGNDLIFNGVGHIENSSLVVTGTVSAEDIIF